MKKAILGFIWICFALTAFAVPRTFYIDFAAGSDANSVASAQSKTTPWKHNPYMTGSTISGYSHVAGDQFIFKGGVTWDHTCFPLTMTAAGSAGNVDYYGVDATWYTGGSWTRPVFDHEYVSCTTHRIVMQGGYALIDNIEMKRLLVSSTATAPGMITSFNVPGNLVTNCYIHGWKTTAVTDDAFGGIIVGTSNPPLDFTVDNTEVENSENNNIVTAVNSSSSFTIGVGSKTFSLSGSFAVTVGQYVQVLSTADNNNFMGGYITGYSGSNLTVDVTTTRGSGTIGSWLIVGPYTASGLCIRCVAIIQNGSKIHDNSSAVLFCLDFNNSYLYNVWGIGFDRVYHYNGIYEDPFGWTTPNTIRTAYIRNSYLHDVYLGANMAYPNIRGGATCVMYNNVLYGAMSAQLAVGIDNFNYSSEGGGYFTAYNNTIYNFSSGAPAFHIGRSSPKVITLTLINNHVMNASALSDSTPTNTTTFINITNLLQNAATAAGQGFTLGNLYAPINATVSTYNAGTDESATFNTDILNTSRPQALIWDIGAYEFIVGGGGATNAFRNTTKTRIGSGGSF